MKKIYLMLCIFLLLMASCSNQEQQPSGTTYPEKTPREGSIALINRYMTAMEQNDTATMLECYDPNVQKSIKGVMDAAGGFFGLGSIYDLMAGSLGLAADQARQEESIRDVNFNFNNILDDSFTRNSGTMNVLYDVVILYEEHTVEGQISKSFDLVKKQDDWYIRSVEEPVEISGFESDSEIFVAEDIPLTEPNTFEEDYDYEIIDGETAVIKKYIGDKKDVIMPYEIEGLPVTLIRGQVFRGSEVTNVEIAGSVKEIGMDSFCCTYSLTEVIIPESVHTIGIFAFAKCDSLAEVRIPESVHTIGRGAFYGCHSLTKANIPDSTTSIGTQIFSHCTSLTDVTLGKNLDEISNNMFHGASSLESINIPEGIISIEYYAFKGCTSLTSLTIPENVEIVRAAFPDCSSLRSIMFLGSVPERLVGDINFAFEGVHPDFTIYYREGADGWRTPLWNGIPAQPK